MEIRIRVMCTGGYVLIVECLYGCLVCRYDVSYVPLIVDCWIDIWKMCSSPHFLLEWINVCILGSGGIFCFRPNQFEFWWSIMYIKNWWWWKWVWMLAVAKKEDWGGGGESVLTGISNLITKHRSDKLQ